MNYQLSQQFRRKYKKYDVRVKKAIGEALNKFSKNPFDPSLDNHALKKELKGLRSIDVTTDYRAIYEPIDENGDFFAYFDDIGTHKELFGS
ncbi:MAG: type II toxin-antitoxin system mRNA interferase toxin, RelE/StbE family [Patescibacteria group bacterium]